MIRLVSLAAAAMAVAFSVAGAVAADRWLEIPEPPALPTPVATGLAPVNGIQMHYAVFGEGEPILLIHGGLGVVTNQVVQSLEGCDATEG